MLSGDSSDFLGSVGNRKREVALMPTVTCVTPDGWYPVIGRSTFSIVRAFSSVCLPRFQQFQMSNVVEVL